MYLKQETLSALERAIGKTVAELSEMDIYEEFQYVESRTKKPLSFSKQLDWRMRGRGNPHIAENRICTMEDIDKRILELV